MATKYSTDFTGTNGTTLDSIGWTVDQDMGTAVSPTIQNNEAVFGPTANTSGTQWYARQDSNPRIARWHFEFTLDKLY